MKAGILATVNFATMGVSPFVALGLNLLGRAMEWACGEVEYRIVEEAMCLENELTKLRQTSGIQLLKLGAVETAEDALKAVNVDKSKIEEFTETEEQLEELDDASRDALHTLDGEQAAEDAKVDHADSEQIQKHAPEEDHADTEQIQKHAAEEDDVDKRKKKQFALTCAYPHARHLCCMCA